VHLNSHPRRQAELAVLNAADFPSVLLEAGFLSSQDDRDRLQSDEGRKALADAVVTALTRWQAIEEATPGFGD
jgi:N-acetylmuramoyl-L-alanine amidase